MEGHLIVQFLSHIWSLNYCKRRQSNGDENALLNPAPILQCFSLNLATTCIRNANNEMLRNLMQNDCPSKYDSWH